MPRHCIFISETGDKCTKSAIYNINTETRGLYCKNHKQDKMIVIGHRKICEEEQCTKTALFGIDKKQYCGTHKKEGMVNLKKRKCNAKDCNTIPYFNFSTKKGGIYCNKHKKEGMINVYKLKCKQDNCNVYPSYGIKKPEWCTVHKPLDAIKFRVKNCEEKDCHISASFNFEGLKPIYCSKHKKKGMINITYQKNLQQKKEITEITKIVEDKECIGTRSTLCNPERNCKSCFERSFASHPKAEFWHQDNPVKPIEVLKQSSREFMFNCDCGHTFTKSLSNLRTQWCPYCCIQIKKLCEDENCIHCFERSFASHPRVKYWHPDNIINPRMVGLSSSKKYKFICEDCKFDYTIALYDIISRNGGCTICRHKTSKKLYKFLQSQYNNIEREKSFDWCINDSTGIKLRYDFYISDYNLIIELDGKQHFQEVVRWKSCVEDTRERDIFKMNCALKNGITIIRIYQPDVYEDKNDWEEKLKKKIKQYDTPTTKYISSCDQYKNFVNCF